jgi:hypothetical protein
MRSHRLTTMSMLLLAAGGLVVGLALPAAGHEAKHLISGSTIKQHSIAGNRLKNNTLTGKQIKESTLGTVPRATAATKLPALKWHSVTLLNSWNDAGAAAGEPPVGYAVDAQGIVYLRGSIDEGVSAEAFTLPANIASATDGFIVPAAIDGTKAGYVEVSQGEVLALDGANPGGAKVDTYLDGISFPAT